MRWPRRRKPRNVTDRGWSNIVLPPCLLCGHPNTLQHECTPSPERAKPDNQQVEPLPLTFSSRWQEWKDEVLALRNDYIKEITMTTPAQGASGNRTDRDRAEYQRGLRDGRLDNTVVRAEVVGSSEWLRDLADRLQQYLEDRVGNLNPEHSAETPYLIREYADEVECDERQTAADTRDRERVEKMVRAAWNADRDAQPYPSLLPTWDDLTDTQRDRCIDYGLELYRAGRDDQENDRG